MKKLIKTLVIFPLLVILLIIINPPAARTNSAAPPEGGLSGDPARTTCALIGCHYGNSGATYSFGPGELTLNMGDTTSNMAAMNGQAYIPGQTYYIELKPNLSNGSTPRYGFQMTSLDASNNMAGSFTIVNTGRNSAESLLSRNYIGHKTANANNDWLFQWTAPPAGTGAVTFYFACNIANGDGTNNGDSIYTGTVVLNPSAASGIFPVQNSFQSFSIYPNPARDFIMLSFESPEVSQAKISLYTLDGKKLQTQDCEVQPATAISIRYTLPKSLTPGIYLFELEAGNHKQTQRVTVM